MDSFDQNLLMLLQQKGNATNAELGKASALSLSQAGRRRQKLEDDGVIAGYHASLSPEKCGLAIQAFIQISLNHHSREGAENLHHYLAHQPEIVNIWSLTGSADYLLQVFCKNLPDLNRLVHDELLGQAAITHVESKIVMSHIKANAPLPLSL
ncbi:MAG: Lrp/AsnC family transcriptional regulator [Candidatus Puniceispirillaceae bacterium]